MKVIAPLGIRKLRAEMEIKNLSLGDVSKASRIPYPTVSGILNGRLISPDRLERIEDAIRRAKYLEAAAK